MMQPIIYEPSLGEDITRTCDRLAEMACASGRPAQATFNGVALTATPGMTGTDLRRRFDDECARRAAAYRHSSEGRGAAREAAARLAGMRRRADVLTATLPAIPFADLRAVIDWCCAFQEASDHVGVEFDRGAIVATFAAHGYEPNANVGDALDPGDQENVARYIIGQALDGLGGESGAIHPVIHRFAEDWRRKFEGGAD